MNDLLETTLAAHGGMEAWSKLSKITAKITVYGGLWELKGHANPFTDATASIDTRKQYTEYCPFGSPGLRSVWEPQRVEIRSDTGEILESRDNPRASFAGHERPTPWDKLHLAYFTGYAIWGYLTTPFYFTLPGVVTEEIEPWREGDETWRRLKVTFPPSIANHCDTQVFYVGPDGLVRRQDYGAEVMGGTSTAHYSLENKTFGGIVYPSRRRAYRRGPDNKPMLDLLGVAIDFHEITPQ